MAAPWHSMAPVPRHGPVRRLVRRRPDGITLLIVALAALAVAHALARTASHGAAIDADGVNYLAAAESLLAGEGLATHRGGAFLLWPPFFPMLTAFAGLPGVDPAEAGRLLNAAAFGLIVLLAGLWLRRELASKVAALGGAVAILVSLPLNDVAARYMTEALFSFLSLLALASLASFQGGRDERLLVAAVLTALAALTRWAGAPLIVVGTLAPLLRGDLPATVRMRRAALFGGVAALPLSLALARNRIVSGTWTGERGHLATGQSLRDSLDQIDAIIARWLFPANAFDAPDGFPWGMVGLAVLIAMAIVCARRRTTGALVAGFIVAYPGFHVIVAPWAFDPGIHDRLLVPVHAPLILAAAFALDGILAMPVGGLARAARWAVLAVIAVAFLTHAGVSVQRNLAVTARALEHGYAGDTFNAKRWEESAAIRFLRERGAGDALILSNATGALHLHGISGAGGLDAAREHPRRLREAVESAADGTWVVWFREQYASAGAALRVAPELAPVAEFPDASIYRVDRASAGDTLASWRAALDAARAVEPLARSAFTIHRLGRALAYARDPCSAADVERGFFLHVTPADEGDLPWGRGEHGFDNLDFPFARWGVRFDGACLAIVPLPDYAIAGVRTGQWARHDGESWSAAFPFPGR